MKKSMISIVVLTSLLIGSLAFAFDYNTVGYVRVSELKVWNSHIDVYFEDSQQHLCAGGQKSRFLINPVKELHYRHILSAFLAGRSVQLAYDCGSDNYPWVVGIRVR